MSTTIAVCLGCMFLANLAVPLLSIAWSFYFTGDDSFALLLHNIIVGVVVYIPLVATAFASATVAKPDNVSQTSCYIYATAVIAVVTFMHIGCYTTTYKRLGKTPLVTQ